MITSSDETECAHTSEAARIPSPRSIAPNWMRPRPPSPRSKVPASTLHSFCPPGRRPAASTARGHTYLAHVTTVAVVVRAQRTPHCTEMHVLYSVMPHCFFFWKKALTSSKVFNGFFLWKKALASQRRQWFFFWPSFLVTIQYHAMRP